MLQFLLKGRYLFAILAILVLFKIFIPVDNRSFNSSPTDLHFTKTRMYYADDVPDSLSWKKYKKIEDSIREEFIQSNRGGSSMNILNIGICKSYEFENEKFVAFHGYQFKDGMTHYFKKNGKKFITDFDKVEMDSGFTPGTRFSKETKLEIDEDASTGKLSILFPINKPVYYVIYGLFVIIGVIFIIVFLHIFIYLPLRVLYNISNGKSFIDENIGSLFTIGRTLLFTGIGVSLIKIIPHFVIRYKIPSIIGFSYYEALMYGWVLVIAGIIVLIIARAFLEGAEMKDEQELTV